MKKQVHLCVLLFVPLCLLFASLGSYAKDEKVIILNKKDKQKLTKKQFGKLKETAQAEDITIVEEYSAPGNPNYICDQDSMLMAGWFLPLSWICTVVDYTCPAPFALIIDTGPNVPNITCNYTCPNTSATPMCDCSLNSGQSASCPS